MSAKYVSLLFDVDADGIATITINRPDKLNALNHEVLADLHGLLMTVRNNASVKAVVITGAGEKAFVAGADISELSDMNELTATALSERGQDLFAMIESSPKPFIALVNGYALGGGCELAMACHLRVATENALLGLPEVTLGLIPGYGGTQRLTHLVGKGRALELILTGNPVKADAALQMGLVNRVVPAAEGMLAAKEILKTIISRGPIAVEKAIESVLAGLESAAHGYKTEAESFGALCATEDFKEGTRAFLEKRKPSFKGN